MRRSTIEKWVAEPFFEDTLPGCLVRLAYKNQYMLGVVVGIEHREPQTYRSVVAA